MTLPLLPHTRQKINVFWQIGKMTQEAIGQGQVLPMAPPLGPDPKFPVRDDLFTKLRAFNFIF